MPDFIHVIIFVTKLLQNTLKFDYDFLYKTKNILDI